MVYDSHPDTTGREQYIRNVEDFLLKVEDEYKNKPNGSKWKESGMPEGKWKVIKCTEGSGVAPRQMEGSNDCGVHLCLFMDLLMKDLEPRLLIDLTMNITRYGRYALWQAIRMKKALFGTTSLLKNDKADLNS